MSWILHGYFGTLWCVLAKVAFLPLFFVTVRKEPDRAAVFLPVDVDIRNQLTFKILSITGGVVGWKVNCSHFRLLPSPSDPNSRLDSSSGVRMCDVASSARLFAEDSTRGFGVVRHASPITSGREKIFPIHDGSGVTLHSNLDL